MLSQLVMHFFVKEAASRAMKDAKEVLLGLRGVKKRHVTGRKQSPSNYLKLLESLKGQPGVTDDLIEAVRKEKALRGDLHSNDFAQTSLQRAQAKIDARRKWSGRHKAREGEEFLPSTGRAAQALGKGDDKYLWRGMALPEATTSPISPGANTAFFTRHPDVAATYAAADSAKAVSRPDNRLFRYNRPKSSVEGAELKPDNITDINNLSPAIGKPVSMEGLTPIQKRLRQKDYGIDPTYETLAPITPKGLSELGTPIEFSVRKARGPKGEVGYALSRVR